MEKSAGKANSTTDLTVKQMKSVLIFEICGRIKAGPSTTLRFGQDDRFLLVHAVEVPLI